MDLDADKWAEHNDNVAWVRSQIDALRELGFEPPTSLARLPDWLGTHKGAVTRKLKGEDNEEGDEE